LIAGFGGVCYFGESAMGWNRHRAGRRPAAERSRFALVIASCVLVLSAGSDRDSAPASERGEAVAPAAPIDSVARFELAADAPIAEVSDRFLSIAVDTASVVGGAFWDPSGGGVMAVVDVPAFDFARPRLRALAAELAPAYLRIGGTDADRIGYAVAGAPAPEAGDWVLTGAQLDAFARFASELDFEIAFAVNAGEAARTPGGAWSPVAARALIRRLAAIGAPVAVWELGNELNAYPVLHGLRVEPAQFAADAHALRAAVDETMPAARVAAPSPAFWPKLGEAFPMTEAFLAAGGGEPLGVLSWHYYPQQSLRCPLRPVPATTGQLLSPARLDEFARWARRVRGWRDRFAPSAELWLGETGHAQCGGEPGLSDSYESGFWWLDQLGLAARLGHAVVVRQTLAGSSYGLLREPTLDPTPDYFSAVLWRRLVGTRVLDLRAVDAPAAVRAYAHCARDGAGDAVVIALNLDAELGHTVALDGLPTGTNEGYLLSAPSLEARELELNGRTLRLGPDDALPPLEPVATPRSADGRVMALPPRSYGFAVMRGAALPACRLPTDRPAGWSRSLPGRP
jgi:heparanase 1